MMDRLAYGTENRSSRSLSFNHRGCDDYRGRQSITLLVYAYMINGQLAKAAVGRKR
jgi:hypothetical protein